MKKVASSPERNTFQMENYIKRQEEQGLEPLEEYIEMFKTWRQQDNENIVNPEWQKNNMEYDLRSTEWILEKVRVGDSYAQNLYAAICNNNFQKLDVMPILKNQTWSASWRSAGGIIANMREQGDYIDWYCSGIGNDESGYGLDHRPANGYVPEGIVTEEIQNDLKKLGWIVLQQDLDNY
jgi:hypothetical protein